MTETFVPPSVALIGPPGSGKSSIAAVYAALVGGRVMSFAEALRLEVAWAIAGSEAQETIARGTHDARKLVRYHYGRMRNPETKDVYRRLLQVWGTEFRREQDADYWVRALVKDFARRSVPVAVDDCRFPNEYAALKELGFVFIRLEPGDTVREQSEEALAHPTEQYWSTFDVDYTLPYTEGPEVQAETLLAALRAGIPVASVRGRRKSG